MKIGVISDTHGSVTAWRQAYNQCFQTVDIIIHCGDVLYHGPRNPLPEGYDPKTLAEELNQYRNLVIVKGNCDAEVDQLMLQFPLESPYVHAITPEYKILAHHGHLWTTETLPEYIPEQYQIIISGHTHIPGIKQLGKSVWLNPGSPALPKNESQEPTVALINGSELMILNARSGAVIVSHKMEYTRIL